MKIITKWKELKKAEEEKKKARLRITYVGNIPQKNVCIRHAFDENLKIKLQPYECFYFSSDKICDEFYCPMRPRNMRYIEACKKYNAAREEFLNALFWRSKSK